MTKNRLAQQTQKSAGIPNGMRTATVAAVSGSAVTISINGGLISSGVGVVTSYAPVVGDTVAVFRQDSSWLILGPTTPSTAGNWVKLSTLGYQNGWSDSGGGFVPGQYRIMADEVKIMGALTNASVVGANTTVVSGLPRPASTITTICAMSASRIRIYVDNAGNLKVTDVTVSGSMQFLFAYPLDSLT